MNFTQNHLHFRSEDPDAAAKFYCDNFGAVITAERPLSTTKSIILELGGRPLMTISGRAEGEDPVPGSTDPRYGLDHFGFEVDDMEAAAANFRANGVHFHLRTLDHAIRFHGGLHRGPRPRQRGDYPAPQE